MTHRPVLDIENLSVTFEQSGARIHTVRAVTLSIPEARTLALVGASGSGKSVTAHALLGLLPDKGTTVHGTVRHEGVSLAGLSSEAIRSLRGRRISMIFQEPMTALNPLHRVGQQIREMILVHGGDASSQRIEALLAQVELTTPAITAQKYPHELSGGQRQRVMIAMAIANNPSLLIADEPTTRCHGSKTDSGSLAQDSARNRHGHLIDYPRSGYCQALCGRCRRDASGKHR